ncbi:hypothetical protein MLD38_006306 [Melastoma candidum]|uniref:Uncharacterized protein n=1 Tax=Melastoma candidum TaxID=119954 RepID=A0ACB9RNQ7_9MYRT|nr:hypothetical protein MLD38_006306 [Melastoma candidum]
MLRLQIPLSPAALPRLNFAAGDVSSSLPSVHGALPAPQRRSATVPNRGFFCIIQRPNSALWNCAGGKFPYRQFSCLDNVYTHGKLQRDVIVRSELANTSTSLPFPEYDLVAKARGICFYTVTAVFAIILFQMMLVAHPFVLLMDRCKRKAHQFIAGIWSTLTVALFYRIEVYGRENLPPSDVPALYVSNHQSFLDIYTLLTLGRNFKFISKTSIFHFPIIGWAMNMMGTVPLKRMDSRSQLECLKQCMHLIQNGASVCVFPEGTRSKDGKLGEFKKGAFTIAAKTKVPVVPITLIGTGRIMPAGHEVSPAFYDKQQLLFLKA